MGLTVDVDIPAATDLLGKSVTDLQSNIKVNKKSIFGTLKYVDDYTDFSGDPEEQAGNYLALHIAVPDVEGVTISAGINNPSVLDEDGLIIIIVRDTKKPIVVTASKEGYKTVTKKFSLRNLVLEEPGE